MPGSLVGIGADGRLVKDLLPLGYPDYRVGGGGVEAENDH
jgi:hypothetical protein